MQQTEVQSVAIDANSPTKSVYFFGAGQAEGTREMRAILGGKGANLAEMTNLGVPVPPGFTIACSVCNDYLRDGRAPDWIGAEVTDALRRLESASKAVPLDANPATAHMFIVKPFSGAGLASLFSSHPPTEARIRALLGGI